MTAARRVSPATLKAWLSDGGELAILDAREEGEFGRAHPFWAVPCPLSRAELTARALLPRREVRVVCCDGGERGGFAERLAAYLATIGCAHVHVLDGGTAAWAAAGFEVFSGVNVPSKAFGEWVEHHHGTPSVSPRELDAMRRSGQPLVVLDSRPMDEFRAMSIPGGVDVPGGELAYRIGALAPDPATTVVVNCAGRTRSILGAESLRRAGVPNRVVALRDGTMGWELAGLALDRGRTETYAPGTPADLPARLAAADAFAREHGVRAIGPADVPALLAERDRTTHVLDVRPAEEFEAGHLPGSRPAPGGQLVQATDRWIAVRGARIVLVDDTGVRARMAGAWLRQLGGWEVLVLDGADLSATGPWRPECPEADAVEVDPVAPSDLAARLDAEPGHVAVVDLTPSVRFRAAHVPGGLWGVRTRLDRLAHRLRDASLVVAAAPEAAVARLAVPELRALAPRAEVRVLDGGLDAWRAAGLPTVSDPRHPADEDCVDAYLRPYDRTSGQEAAMREYLSWEVDLPAQVARDGDARFGRA